MAAKKTQTLNLRIDPVVKKAVKKAAQKEYRSVANFVEWLVMDYCTRQGIEAADIGTRR